MIPNAQKLREAYQKASPMVQRFITSPELSVAFTEIRETHKLHLDEAGALSNALNAVFLELMPYEKFPELLKEALEQNSNTYEAVLKEVNEKIFTMFRKKLSEPEEKVDTLVSKSDSLTTAPTNSSILETKETITSEVKEQPVVSATNPLQNSVRKTPTEIKIKAPETEKGLGKKGPENQVEVDPYREPIE